jgi:hypothetical protein
VVFLPAGGLTSAENRRIQAMLRIVNARVMHFPGLVIAETAYRQSC